MSASSDFEGVFKLIEFNTHEVTERVDTLHLQRKGILFEGTLKTEFCYGFVPYQSNEFPVSGLFDTLENVLTLRYVSGNGYESNLFLKFEDEVYTGYYSSLSEWRDRWEKIA